MAGCATVTVLDPVSGKLITINVPTPQLGSRTGRLGSFAVREDSETGRRLQALLAANTPRHLDHILGRSGSELLPCLMRTAPAFRTARDAQPLVPTGTPIADSAPFRRVHIILASLSLRPDTQVL